MFFVLSKILWMLSAPANVIVLLLAAGSVLLLRGDLAWGRALVVAATALFVLLGALPVGTVLLRLLEDRFPAPSLDGVKPSGVIVLGGAVDQIVSRERGQIELTDAATRLTAGAVLARRFPDAKILYTGGSNALVEQNDGEAEWAKRLLVDLGVPAERILVENASRNTEENARFSRALVEPKADDVWLLVTSAYHMPRSVGVFRAAGFGVMPFPVDYRTSGTWRDYEPSRDAGFGLDRFAFASREWVGLLAYRLTGRTGAFFPGP